MEADWGDVHIAYHKYVEISHRWTPCHCEVHNPANMWENSLHIRARWYVFKRARLVGSIFRGSIPAHEEAGACVLCPNKDDLRGSLRQVWERASLRCVTF